MKTFLLLWRKNEIWFFLLPQVPKICELVWISPIKALKFIRVFKPLELMTGENTVCKNWGCPVPRSDLQPGASRPETVQGLGSKTQPVTRKIKYLIKKCTQPIGRRWKSSVQRKINSKVWEIFMVFPVGFRPSPLTIINRRIWRQQHRNCFNVLVVRILLQGVELWLINCLTHGYLSCKTKFPRRDCCHLDLGNS